MNAFDAGILPVEIAVGRRGEQAVEARGVGAVARDHLVGLTTLPRLFDILAPSLITMPCVNRRSTGSSLVIRPRSRMNLVQKRE